MARPRFAVAVFPGTNNDLDTYYVLRDVLDVPAELVWYRRQSLRRFQALILPGGFSFGDYLRVGAIAARSPLVAAIPEFVERGGIVLGICNGFQILLEAGLLPGVVLRNRTLRFISRFVHIRVETSDSPFTCACEEGEVLRLPIAHGDGNYFALPGTLRRLNAERRVVFRFCDARGEVTQTANPNGSLENITGVLSADRRILGMMPHPERASRAYLGSNDGLRIFQSMLQYLGVRSARIPVRA